MNPYETLKTPFTALAPMEGVTDIAFRQVVAKAARPDLFYPKQASKPLRLSLPQGTLSFHYSTEPQKSQALTESPNPATLKPQQGQNKKGN